MITSILFSLRRKVRHYRKTMITRLKSLKYLDDRPVFDNERRTAEAWSRGGPEEESAERQRIRDEEAAERQRNMDGTI